MRLKLGSQNEFVKVIQPLSGRIVCKLHVWILRINTVAPPNEYHLILHLSHFYWHENSELNKFFSHIMNQTTYV